MKIRFCVDTKMKVALSALNPFQNDMKKLMPPEYLALRAEIEETGFSFAPHVWRDPDGVYQILDGHQRVECLKRMQAESVTDEDIMVPVVEVEARDFREAKRKCLAGAATYGKMNLEGVAQTISQAELAPLRAATMFRFPDVDLKELDPTPPKKVEFSASTKPKEPKHECPSCGHKF